MFYLVFNGLFFCFFDGYQLFNSFTSNVHFNFVSFLLTSPSKPLKYSPFNLHMIFSSSYTNTYLHNYIKKTNTASKRG
jgi:hypothetical protein